MKDKDIDSILKLVSRISNQVDLIDKGKSFVETTGKRRLDIIKDNSKRIREIVTKKD